MGFAHFWLSGFDQIRVSFWAYLFVGLQNGALYAMIAVGYTLVYGVLGLINFAHGDVLMVGAMVALAAADSTLLRVVGFVGVVLAAGNAVGGYVVTERMLKMFVTAGRKQEKKER